MSLLKGALAYCGDTEYLIDSPGNDFREVDLTFLTKEITIV